MEVFKFIKNIYSGEKVLEKHITLFSLTGIMVLLFCCYGASVGNILFPNIFIAPPESPLVSTVELFTGLLIFIYLTGYSFYFSNSKFAHIELGIPEFGYLKPFTAFIKILPVFLVWLLYYTAFVAIGIIAFLNIDQIGLVYIFGAVMICVIPFILLMFVDYSKNFHFRRKFFNPFSVLKYIDKALGDIIYLSVEVFILFSIVTAGIFYITTFKISSDSVRLAVWLMSACIWVYFVLIFKYTYYTGLVKIVNKYPELNS